MVQCFFARAQEISESQGNRVLGCSALNQKWSGNRAPGTGDAGAFPGSHSGALPAAPHP